MWALIDNQEFVQGFNVPAPFTRPNGDYCSADVFTLLSEGELAELGIVTVEATNRPSPTVYDISNQWSAALVNGAWKQVWVTSVPADKAGRLTALIARQCALVDQSEVVLRDQGVTIGDKVLQIRVPPEEDISFINSCVLAASMAKAANQPFSQSFTMQDNTEMVFDADQMIAAGYTAMARVNAIHQAAVTVKNAIRTAGAYAGELTDQVYEAKCTAVLAVSTDVTV